jgi:hypothetical protein
MKSPFFKQQRGVIYVELFGYTLLVVVVLVVVFMRG